MDFLVRLSQKRLLNDLVGLVRKQKTVQDKNADGKEQEASRKG